MAPIICKKKETSTKKMKTKRNGSVQRGKRNGKKKIIRQQKLKLSENTGVQRIKWRRIKKVKYKN